MNPGTCVWYLGEVADYYMTVRDRTTGVVEAAGTAGLVNVGDDDFDVWSTDAPDDGMVVVTWGHDRAQWEYLVDLVEVTPTAPDLIPEVIHMPDLHGPVSEIQYADPEGGWVHSDLNPADREFLHASLDEYLDKSHNGHNGFFYVANSGDIGAEFG